MRNSERVEDLSNGTWTDSHNTSSFGFTMSQKLKFNTFYVVYTNERDRAKHAIANMDAFCEYDPSTRYNKRLRLRRSDIIG